MDTSATRDTLNVRGIDAQTVVALKAQARARNLTVGGMIERLVLLFNDARASDEGAVRAMLDDAGLGPIGF